MHSIVGSLHKIASSPSHLQVGAHQAPCLHTPSCSPRGGTWRIDGRRDCLPLKPWGELVALPQIPGLRLQKSLLGRHHKKLPLRRLVSGQKGHGTCGSIECAMGQPLMMRKMRDVRRFQTMTVSHHILFMFDDVRNIPLAVLEGDTVQLAFGGGAPKVIWAWQTRKRTGPRWP